MKKTKGLLILPAMLLAGAALSGCNVNGNTRYLDVNNKSEDKEKLYKVLEDYEGLETSNVLNDVGLSFNVNSLNATGDYSIYEKSTESATGYNVRTLKNAIFNVENYKAVETTVPNWLLQNVKLGKSSGGGSEPAHTTGYDVDYEQNYDAGGEFDGTYTCYITGEAGEGTALGDDTPIRDCVYYEDENGIGNFYPVTKIDTSYLESPGNVISINICHNPDYDRVEKISGSTLTLSYENLGNLENLERIIFADSLIYENVVFADNSFGGNETLKEIYMAQNDISVQVGYQAFEGCTSLTYFNSYEEVDSTQFFANITTIGDYAFAGCTNLPGESGALYLSNTTTIGVNAFSIDQESGYDQPASLPNEIHLPKATELKNGCFSMHDPDATIFFFFEDPDYDVTKVICYQRPDAENPSELLDDPATNPSAYDFLTYSGVLESGQSISQYLTNEEIVQDPKLNNLLTIERNPGNNVNSSKSNKLTSTNNLITSINNNDEEEEEESPMLQFTYWLCFPLRREIAYYLIGTEAYGEPWQKMKTSFYLETSDSGNEHINFDIEIDNLSEFVSEFTEKTYGSSILPFDGTGTLYASVKTDDYGYIKSLDLKVNGDNINFSIGDARKIRPNSNSSLALTNTNGSIIENLFNGGFKFSGKLTLDASLQLNHTYAESKDAIFYQTYETEDGTIVTEPRTDGKYTLKAQQVSINPFNSNKIYANSATAMYDNNTYNVTIIPSKIKGTDQYYSVVDDAEYCYVSVNGVKVSKLLKEKPEDSVINSITCDYCYIYPGAGTKGGYTTYKVSIGRGFVNRIKSTLGNDAVFQINIGITK